MQNAPRNKQMFPPAYQKRWPRTTAALARLEQLSARLASLRAEYGEYDPRTQAAEQAAAVAADCPKATEADEAKTAGNAVALSGEKEAAVAGGYHCPCGRLIGFDPTPRRCPECNRRFSAVVRP